MSTAKKWSKVEEEQLLDEVRQGLDMETIAEKHNRNVGGVSIRLKKLLINLIDNNELTEQQAFDVYKVTKEDLEASRQYEAKRATKLTGSERVDKAKQLLQQAIALL